MSKHSRSFCRATFSFLPSSFLKESGHFCFFEHACSTCNIAEVNATFGAFHRSGWTIFVFGCELSPRTASTAVPTSVAGAVAVERFPVDGGLHRSGVHPVGGEHALISSDGAQPQATVRAFAIIANKHIPLPFVRDNPVYAKRAEGVM